MHGILALGAAHLHSRTTLNLKENIDRHRSLAMQGLNAKELILSGKAKPSFEDNGTRLSAVLATCYLLAFTSSYMGDSLGLFLVLVRACSSLTGQIVQAGHSSPLLPWNARSATAEPHLEVMRRRLRNASPLPAQDVSDAKISLELAEKHCDFLPFQWNVLQSMKSAIEHVDKPFEGMLPRYRVRIHRI